MFTRATPLLHVTDKISGETFLVDTGAEVSIITPRPGDKEAAVGAKLTAANGSGITTYGRRTRRIRLQCGEFSWSFIVAKAKNIIGADLLRRYGLMVDLKGKKLVNFETSSMVRGKVLPVLDNVRGISMVSTSVPGSFEDEIRQLVKQRP